MNSKNMESHLDILYMMTKGILDNRDVCWGYEENSIIHHQVFYMQDQAYLRLVHFRALTLTPITRILD